MPLGKPPRTFFIDSRMHQPLILHSLVRDRGLSWEGVLRECIYRKCLPEADFKLVRSQVPIPKPNVTRKSITNEHEN